MIYLKRFLMTVGALAILAPFIIYFILNNLVTDWTPPELSGHPNASWKGDPDGAWGEFIEIVKFEHPYYLIEVRNKNGDFLKSGWIKSGETNIDHIKNDDLISTPDIRSFSDDGDGVVFLCKDKYLAASKNEAKN